MTREQTTFRRAFELIKIASDVKNGLDRVFSLQYDGTTLAQVKKQIEDAVKQHG